MTAFSRALRLRDVIRRVARREVDRLRPGPAYAVVVSIDRTNRKCVVHMDNDPAGVNITVSMGSVQPSTTNQRVRIEGVTGDRFLTAVLGPGFYA